MEKNVIMMNLYCRRQRMSSNKSVREELERKIKILKSIHYKDNYKKLTEKLAPMAYWEGDPYYPIEIIYE